MNRNLMGRQEPDVIAYVSARPEHERCLDEHVRCCLCGTGLRFERATDLAELTVSEISFCPSCQIRSRPRRHALQ
jgi:hypothetical protein